MPHDVLILLGIVCAVVLVLGLPILMFLFLLGGPPR